MRKYPSRRMLSWLSLLLVCIVPVSPAKDQPVQVVNWPETGTPVVRFSFGKFKEVGSLGSQRTYVTDTTAENLWTKKIVDANFRLYLYDKNKTRIAEAQLTVSNVAPGETIKFQITLASSGPPASLSVVATYLPKELGPVAPTRLVSITVNTVPQGAVAKLDGAEVGTTPKIVQVGAGKHVLEFTKEGFNPGKFPFEIGPDDASGGSVSFELGTSAHDTVELRDGSVLSGDLVSVSGMEVVVKVGGSDQHLERNQIKRILFVQRQPSGDNP
ncbi:MAG TPA: PEGA domain-containing protein [Candidatus Solibacter sp.]|nr:PEGA domain-containing protein [Candidatus Solibacter sp.]